MRLLICAGGTGGGVYPALAVLQALYERDEAATLWVGGYGGMEAGLVVRQGIPFQSIPAAGVHGVGLKVLPGNLRRLARGFRASREILRFFQPDVVFYTGGYVAVPMAAAARLPLPGLKQPKTLAYIPDIEPGLALKAIIRFADQVALTTEDSRVYLPREKKAIVTGYPVRPDLKEWSRKAGRFLLDLQDEIPVLLVTGGSRGARSINETILNSLPRLLREMQVVHVTGELDWHDIQKKTAALPADLAPRYRAFPYLHEEMGAALSAADLVVSRAGASCLGEYPLFGLPAILVPYPHAWRYQHLNASYLEKQGAAVQIRDEEIPVKLLPQVFELIRGREKLAAMSAAMRSLAQPRAAESIAAMLVSLSK